MSGKRTTKTETVERRKSVSDSNSRAKVKREKAIKQSKKDGTEPILDLIQTETVNKAVASQQFADPFTSLYTLGEVSGDSFQPVAPTFNPHIMKRIPIENNILLQCIDAMELNVSGTGHNWEYIGPDDGETEESAESQSELADMKAFASAPNEEYSMTELRKRVRRDKETFGYAFIEVTRDTQGNVFTAYHVPAHSMRITTPESKAVSVDYEVLREGKPVKITRMKHFRRFVQLNGSAATQRIYFKEYGDDRIVSNKTGKVDDNTPIEERASEIIFVCDYKSGHLYGYPRWINQMPSILGSRESEVVNLDFFKDNAIPALAVLVSGGYLSDDTVDAIGDKFNGVRGRKKMNEVLIIEAIGDDQAAKPDGQIPVPRLEMKPLAGERQGDMLFQEYDKESRLKIRSAFRLPPIILGMSDDYTRATAEASMVVVESQVFQPERDLEDLLINKCLLSDGVNLPKFWRFKSNPTRIFDKADLVDSVDKLEKAGALTPNVAINLANQMFGTQIKPVDAIWGDYPFAMVIELIKKKGVMINGIEDLVTQIEEAVPEDTQDPTDNTDEPSDVDLEQPDVNKQKLAKSLRSFSGKLKDAAKEAANA